MDIEELKQRVKKSRKEGFSDEDIMKAMRGDGIPKQKVARVFDLLSDERKGTDRRGPRNGRKRTKKAVRGKGKNDKAVEKDSMTRKKPGFLSEDKYKLKQKLFSLTNAYHVYSDEDDLVLKAKQKLFKLKENIKFRDPDGNLVFEVNAEQITDIAGDYTLLRDEEPMTTLEKKYTIATHRWKIKAHDSSERLLAKVESKNPFVAWMRVLGSHVPLIPNVFAFIPHKYEIKTGDDRKIGKIEGKLSIRDTYIIEIDKEKTASSDEILASAIAIDALEGN